MKREWWETKRNEESSELVIIRFETILPCAISMISIRRLLLFQIVRMVWFRVAIIKQSSHRYSQQMSVRCIDRMRFKVKLFYDY
mmetsp:Transcript_6409/g.13646  ORF Transcript_6409/g.13646 Transcript_6409/m.13646 type:complete len:84 (-) Transcript_6409:124-375(-)